MPRGCGSPWRGARSPTPRTSRNWPSRTWSGSSPGRSGSWGAERGGRVATEGVMPRLGADMQEGKVVRWLKKEGERITKGEIIAEVETDKADIEMEAYGSGVVRKILTPEGQVAPVGTLVAVIAEEREDISAL